MSAVLWTIFTCALTAGRNENEPADATPTQPVTVSAVSGETVVAHEVAVISAQRACAPVASWMRAHPGQYPASMVLKLDATYQVSVVKWTYPAPARMWTLAICTK